MIVPNAHLAVVDEAKLVDYCLNPAHPRGRHKARVFRASLGLTSLNAMVLRAALLDAVRTIEATIGSRDFYGQRYVVDFQMTGPSGVATIRSAWIIQVGQDFPRLSTCYVL